MVPGAGEMMGAAHAPPFEETRESLEQRAQDTAHAIVALNVQVEQLLESLPPDDKGEQEQMRILEDLIAQNKQAGQSLRREKDLVRQLLRHVHTAMVDVSHRTGGCLPCAPAAPLRLF